MLVFFQYWISFIILLLSVCGFSFSGLPAEKHLAVLCYHHINSPSGRPYASTLAQFDEQIAALKKAGFKFVSLKNIEDYYYHNKDIPDKSVAITFDDSSMTVYRDAYPYLQQRHIPFAIFIYPSITRYGTRKYTCTWNQLKEMQAHGVIMGCHSYYHPILTNPGLGDRVFSPAGYATWLKLQTAGGKKVLEDNLGISVNYFAIPFGAADTIVHQAVKDAGYTLCFNVSGGNNGAESSPLNLNRTIVLTGHSAERVVQFCTPRALSIETSPNNFSRVYTNTPTLSITVKNIGKFTAPFVFSGTYLPPRNVRPDSSGHVTVPVVLPRTGFYFCSLETQDAQKNQYKAIWLFIYTKTKPFFLP